MAPLPHPKTEADARVACKPVCEPHAGPRSILNSASSSWELKDKSTMDRGPAWGLQTGLRATCEWPPFGDNDQRRKNQTIKSTKIQSPSEQVFI